MKYKSKNKTVEMDKFQQFKSKVDKIIKDEMKIKIQEEKKNEKDQLKKFEKEGGVDNDQNRDQYMAIKFMNFYISQKIMYIDYSKKTGKLKNENDYMKQLRDSVVIVRKNKSGKILFTKINFSALYEFLDYLDKKLPFNILTRRMLLSKITMINFWNKVTNLVKFNMMAKNTLLLNLKHSMT